MRTRFILLLLALFTPFTLHAVEDKPGKEGLESLRQCIMQNDEAVCYKMLTAHSIGFLDRISSYKLMPCLPTNFTYKEEKKDGIWTIVTALLPYNNERDYVFRLAFTDVEKGFKLDIPETLRRGLGEKWENKMNMAESMFLILRANAGQLTCDQLQSLIPQK